MNIIFITSTYYLLILIIVFKYIGKIFETYLTLRLFKGYLKKQDIEYCTKSVTNKNSYIIWINLLKDLFRNCFLKIEFN